MSLPGDGRLHDEYFFTPDSLTSPDSKYGALDLLKALDDEVSGPKSFATLSVMSTIAKVEHVLATRSEEPRFVSARREWGELMSILEATAELICGLDENVEEGSLTESFEVELHRLTVLSKAASVISNLQSVEVIEGETSLRMTSSSDVVEAVINPIEDSRQKYLDECSALLDKAEDLKELLSDEIDYRLRKVNAESLANVKSESIEFAVSAEPYELDAFRKTNTMRWLNDVLKWQVIDMNVQMQKEAQIEEYRALLNMKKSKIKEILCKKIDKAAELKQMQIANRMLDRALEGLGEEDMQSVTLARISARSIGSLGSTAASSPPAVTPSVQMVQSNNIKAHQESHIVLQNPQAVE